MNAHLIIPTCIINQKIKALSLELLVVVLEKLSSCILEAFVDLVLNCELPDLFVKSLKDLMSDHLELKVKADE